MVYFPKEYDEQQKHGGLSKEKVISLNGAWQICFVEDLEKCAEIPLVADDVKDVVGGRKRMDRTGSFLIEKNFMTPQIVELKKALDDKQKLKNPSAYRYETGLIPEKHLWMQLTSLLAKEKPVLMNYDFDELRGVYLTGCFNINPPLIPVADYSRINGYITLGGRGSRGRDDKVGVRTSVDMIK